MSELSLIAVNVLSDGEFESAWGVRWRWRLEFEVKSRCVNKCVVYRLVLRPKNRKISNLPEKLFHPSTLKFFLFCVAAIGIHKRIIFLNMELRKSSRFERKSISMKSRNWKRIFCYSQCYYSVMKILLNFQMTTTTLSGWVREFREWKFQFHPLQHQQREWDFLGWMIGEKRGGKQKWIRMKMW